jgi:hypothetical protein
VGKFARGIREKSMDLEKFCNPQYMEMWTGTCRVVRVARFRFSLFNLNQAVKISLFQTVKISLFRTVKISLSKLSKFHFSNCQNFLFQTVKIFFFKLSKFPFPNCQNFIFQTVKISFFKLSKFFFFPGVQKPQKFPPVYKLLDIKTMHFPQHFNKVLFFGKPHKFQNAPQP